MVLQECQSKLLVKQILVCKIADFSSGCQSVLDRLAASLSYLGWIVTVNELLEICESVPLMVAEPVAEIEPPCSGTKFTVTIQV